MRHTTKERNAAFELTWSLEIQDRTLELAYAVEAFEELYVGDRLWDYDSSNKRAPDPFGVYRFVRDGSLRLVFAQAPRPPNVLPAVTYPPLFSRVRAHETHQKKIPIALPVNEYSALARNIDAETVLEEVSRVFFVLSCRLRSTLDEDPVPPPFESADEAGYIVYDPALVISSTPVDKLHVRRRSGDIARFALPGELA